MMSHRWVELQLPCEKRLESTALRGKNQISYNVQPSLGGWQFYHGPQIMTSTRLIFEIFLVLMWRPYCVQFCSLHILLYLIRQITGSDLSQTYVRKYYLHLGPDAGVSRGSSCVCTCISTVAMTLSEVIGFFFILRLTYILWQCAYIWHRPLGFTMTRDFCFLCIKIGFFLCETRYSLRWWQYYHMLVMKFINGHDTFVHFQLSLFTFLWKRSLNTIRLWTNRI